MNENIHNIYIVSLEKGIYEQNKNACNNQWESHDS